MKKSFLFLGTFVLFFLSCTSKTESPQEKDITFSAVTPLNPPKYICYKTPGEIKIDGKLNDWEDIPWTSDFTDIEGDKRPAPLFQTRAKMTYDTKGMYFAALMVEPHVWAYQKDHDCVIFHENDFEIFLDPTGGTHNYLEYEVNALGTEWDLFLDKPYRDGPTVLNGWELAGMKSAVWVDGTINNPNDTDKSWSVEVFIPWETINQVKRGKKGVPQNGEQFRVNFSRVEWTTEAKEGKYVKVPIKGEKNIREYNWVWAPTGVINIHMPEYWGYVQFSDKVAGKEEDVFKQKPEEATKWILRQLYYRQNKYKKETGVFASSIKTLKASDICDAQQLTNLKLEKTSSMYEISLPDIKGVTWKINHKGLVWK